MSTSPSFFSKLISENGINYLNTGLMLLSMAAAYILPFEVFLFSYAILGPLHYLTEISWLDKKNFFIKSKKDIWVFVVLVVLITIGMLNQTSKINLYLGSILFSGFAYALIILFTDRLSVKIVLVFVVFVLSLLLNVNDYSNFAFLVFVIWLPTIVHVFIFTGAFIFYGALKSRSISGLISLLVFTGCALFLLFFSPAGIEQYVSGYAQKVYPDFTALNTTLYNLFGYGNMETGDTAIYTNEHAVSIMRFIAFAYTYHYLNWFSKTTVIKWNRISKTRMSVIIFLWILSIVLYMLSFKTGFIALFLLSLLHVFFEFPLNHKTFIGIGKELKAIIRK